jgi:RNA polymerase sigma-54 factor
MRLDVSLQQKLQTTLRMHPQQIQAIELLQLPSLDLKDRIDLELAENEVLEVDDRAPDPSEVAPVRETFEAAEGDPTEGGAEPADAEFSETIDYLTRVQDEDRAWGLNRRGSESQEAADRKLEALQATPAPPPTVQDRLADQLPVDAPHHLLVLARAIVYCLDRDGSLPVHPLARPILDAMDDEGRLVRPLEEVVDGIQEPVATEDEPEAVDLPGSYGNNYGGAGTGGRRPAGRKRAAHRDPERAEAQRESRARDREEVREERRREAARVAAAASALRLRMAREGRSAADGEAMALLFPLSEVLDYLEGSGEDFQASLADAEEALRLVQAQEPRGIAGRTLEETLLLQLRPADPLRERKETLIRRHLTDWHKNRLPRIAQGMGLSLVEVRELLGEMEDLHARPGAVLQEERSAYVHPDVVIQWAPDGYEVELVNEYFPTLRISPRYLRLFDDAATDPTLREHLKKKIGSARWLIDAIRQRQDTLMRVVRSIVSYQSEFLDQGLTSIRPLKMQRIADDLGIHVSTVSRAIADKYAQTPQGIFPLKFFFHGGTESSDGTVESRLNVKDRVRQAIEAEDKRNPLSDEELAQRFQGDGLNIARRTVTKYRKQLRIPSSRERKEWS